MLHTKFVEICPMVFGKRIFLNVFTIHVYILAWQSYWSCDQNHVFEFSKHTYKIWLKMAQWFLRNARAKVSQGKEMTLTFIS